LLLGVFLLSKIDRADTTLVFTYPNFPIDFSSERVPSENIFIKQRFDKEFLNTSFLMISNTFLLLRVH